MRFVDKLLAASRRNKSLLCVELDKHKLVLDMHAAVVVTLLPTCHS